MAKAKDSSAAAALSPEDQAVLLRAIKAIRGCGDLDAEATARTLKPEQLAKIVELERAGKRQQIIPILY